MPSLKVNVSHKLSQKKALTRIKDLFSELQQEHKKKISNVKQEWGKNKGDFEFTSYGYDIAGTISVDPANVEIRAKVPLAVSLFKKKIKGVIKEKGKDLLAK